MSIGPAMGIAGGYASASVSQTKGDADRAVQEISDRQAVVAAEQKAEAAAGLGEAEAQSEASERDADGRRIWEWPVRGSDPDPEPDAPVVSKDATGMRGTRLDISG